MTALLSMQLGTKQGGPVYAWRACIVHTGGPANCFYMHYALYQNLNIIIMINWNGLHQASHTICLIKPNFYLFQEFSLQKGRKI